MNQARDTNRLSDSGGNTEVPGCGMYLASYTCRSSLPSMNPGYVHCAGVSCLGGNEAGASCLGHFRL